MNVLSLQIRPNSSHLDSYGILPPPHPDLKMPTGQQNGVSSRPEVWSMTERYESLIRKGRGEIVFHTPLHFFGNIPTQHFQMSMGALGCYQPSISFSGISIRLSHQTFLKYPLFQKFFHLLIQQGKLNVQKTVTQNLLGSSLKNVADSVQTPSAQPTDLKLISKTQLDLQQRIETLEPEKQNRLNDINHKRALEGKTPISFLETTRQIQSILNNPALSDKEKQKQIDQIRKDLGLSQKVMKELFTKRLASLYKEFANKIKAYLNSLKEAAKDAERTYGKDSAQAKAALDRLNQATQASEPTFKNLESKSKALGSMYKKRGFFSKLGGAFKSIGKGILKVGKIAAKVIDKLSPLFRLIPVVGQALSVGWNVAKGLYQVAKGNFKGFLNTALNFASSIPGIGPAISFGSKLAKGVYQAAKGNFSSLFQTAISFAGKIPGAGPFISWGSKFAKGIYAGAKGNFTGMIGTLLDAGGKLPKVGSLFSKASSLYGKVMKRYEQIHSLLKGNISPVIQELQQHIPIEKGSKLIGQ